MSEITMELVDSEDIDNQDVPEEITDEEPYLFDLAIYGKTYHINLQWLLNLRNGISSEQSDYELEESLEKVSAYMHLFSVAYELAKEKQTTTELEYDIWEAEKLQEAERKLHEKQLLEVVEGKRTKSGIVLSSSAVKAEMINLNKEEYTKRKEEISKLQNLSEFLYREMKIIEQRGNHLQSLLKRRTELRS